MFRNCSANTYRAEIDSTEGNRCGRHVALLERYQITPLTRLVRGPSHQFLRSFRPNKGPYALPLTQTFMSTFNDVESGTSNDRIGPIGAPTAKGCEFPNDCGRDTVHTLRVITNGWFVRMFPNMRDQPAHTRIRACTGQVSL